MVDQEKVREGVRLILEGIGEDINREGLIETPDRIARMYCELAGGMDQNAAIHLEKRFHVDNADMVVEKDITFYSMCEHHMLPFFGKAHVAYIPNGEVVGLSKIARTVEVFARRLQLQEQLTAQIADAFMDNPAPAGRYGYDRGRASLHDDAWDQKTGAQTVTTVTRGVFDNNKELQDTFYQMVRL